MRVLTFILFFVLPFVIDAQSLQKRLDLDSIKGLGGEVYYPEPNLDYDSASYSISGVVVNAEGIFLPYATVDVDGKVYGSTDTNGKFSISFKNNRSTEVSISNYNHNCITFVADKKYNNKVFIIKLTHQTEIKKLARELGRKATFVRNWFSEDWNIGASKPAIYLYPETQQEITITHNFKGSLHTVYPTYNKTDGWNVIANSDGRIYNPTDKRYYSYLFWEGVCSFDAEHFNYKSGFYVNKTEYTSFLLEKLSQVGLNETEINDFIVYWLPIFNNYERVFIHFRINDDIGGSSQLIVTPKPDTTIRLFMEFRKYDGEAKLPEQELPHIERHKFTLVEWGGGEIGLDKIK